ncbi:MAG: M13 family metallopeptidase [Bacteroidetes bacterium]|nr:M13 family metallopeptidase [Bacteroidota bacterium]
MRNISLLLSLFVLFVINSSVFSQDDDKPKQLKGFSVEYMDQSVKPGDDFYKYVNGTWLKNNPVPPQYSRWGAFSEITVNNDKIIKEILEEAAKGTAPQGSNTQKIGDLYFTAMDTARIEADKFNPLIPYFNKIDAVKSTDDLIKTIAFLQMNGIGNSFGVFAGQDDKNSSNIIPNFNQGGITLFDRDYYLKEDDRSKDIRAKYVDHTAKMFMLTGIDEATSRNYAERILAFETEWATNFMPRVSMRNPDSTYHKMTIEDFRAMTPNINWTNYFIEVAADPSIFDNGINVGTPRFYAFLNDKFGKGPVILDDWKIYLKWRLISGTADYLSSDFTNEDFEFFSKYLSGVQVQQPRWREALGFVNGTMAEALGKLYVDKAFSPAAKEKVNNMVKNILATLKETIGELDWMSAATKEKAYKKLSTFRVKMGYPDKWKDFSALDINRSNTLFENMMNARRFNYRRNMNKIGKPVDREEWGMFPHLVNASYNSSKNDITFPAGILQPPFFDPNADDALNYGGIGGVIGHEITHGFDDSGRKYDADGNLTDWWTEEDAKNYTMRADKVVEQFNEYVAVDTSHVNGQLTLGENIADLGGMVIAYKSFLKTLKGNEPKIDGFTPQQRFFLAWATVWRDNMTDQEQRLRLKTDSHSPGKFRGYANLTNFQPFYDAFGIKDTDPIARPKDKRVRIW